MSARGKEIRKFILQTVRDHPQDLVGFVAGQFEISRQAVGRHVYELVRTGQIEAKGERKARRYNLAILSKKVVDLNLAGLQEDTAWREHIRGFVSDLPQNVIDLWHYGCTEMINNAIDHSGGSVLGVAVKRTAIDTEVDVFDDGVGIFRKIKEECGLEDERHSVLELAKGKLTTDPENHTGEGIFFTSRMMDDFAILSGEVYLSHEYGKEEDWILRVERPATGTSVIMLLENQNKRKPDDVFRQYTAEEEDYGFRKTVIPVRLAREGSEQLVSRSQAKRLLARVDRFTTVILDFSGVDRIGRAFTDEIFRVFARANPRILLIPINTNVEITGMITSVRSVSSGGELDSGSHF